MMMTTKTTATNTRLLERKSNGRNETRNDSVFIDEAEDSIASRTKRRRNQQPDDDEDENNSYEY